MEALVEYVFGTYPSWSHLVVRIALGIIFFAHGAQKTFGWFGGRGLSATIAGFRQMNIPPAAALSRRSSSAWVA
jgi:putative oxidoreductase